MRLTVFQYMSVLSQDAAVDPVSFVNVLSLVISLLVLLVGTIVLAITLLGYVRLGRRVEEQKRQNEQLQKGLEDLKQKFVMQIAAQAQVAAEQTHREKTLDALQDKLDDLDTRLINQQHALDNAVLAMSLLERGEQQYGSKDLKGALETYQRALQLSPANPGAYYHIGYIYAQRGDLDTAERHLQQALQLDTVYSPALAALGYVYRRQAEAVPDDPKRRDEFLFKAEAHLFKALYSAPRLLNEDGESWWVTLAGLYRDRGQSNRAVEAYEKAIKITPSSPYPLRQLALYHGMDGAVEKMHELFREVEQRARSRIQAQPDNYWPYTDLLIARLAAGKIQEAEETLNTVLRALPGDLFYAVPSLLNSLEKLARILPEQTAHIADVIQYIRTATAANPAVPAPARLENIAFVVTFPNSLPAIGVLVADHDQPADVAARLDLKEPRPTVFVLGGAGNMAEADMQQTRAMVEEGLVSYAQEHGLALVDGGTHGGVMQLLGEGRLRHKATFPLVGVAPVNQVKYAGYDNPDGYDLDPHHSHFVLTPAGDWGDETDMLVQLAHALTGVGQCPGLGLIINGGAVVRQEVYRLTISERLRSPLLVLDGSGRFADALASAYRNPETTEDRELLEIIRRGKLHFVKVEDGPQALQAALNRLLELQK